MRRPAVSVLLAASLVLFGCGGKDAEETEVPPPGEGIWFTGVVRLHDARVAIGGETDPYGYVLKGDHQQAMHKYLTCPGLTKEDRKKLAPLVGKRLYLRMDGSLSGHELKAYVGRKVHVTGTLDALSAGGVETPLRHFPVLDVVEMKEVS